jgi:glycosyltransferase involved in cell wall biosynthesis
MAADALLLYIPSGINAQSVLTGKIFEYLRSGKPVLAVVPPDGIAAELLNKAGTGFIADHTDLKGIESNIAALFRTWERDELRNLKPNMEFVNRFSREKLTLELAGLIREVTDV